MTEADRRGIEWDCARLINLFASHTDAARWEALATLFTEGATFFRPTAPSEPIVGREALMASFRARPARTTRHVCTNIVIEPESDIAAKGSSTVLLYVGPAAEGADLPALSDPAPLIGRYEDRFERTREGWRFSERRGSLSFRP